jgi:uncharacterized cupin superfamily protein
MKQSRPTALGAETIAPRRGSGYPAPFDAPCRERLKRALGEPFGLHDFGVNLVTLPPGAWSSQRHWHSHEDELIYVVSGTPTLVTDGGETALAPGMCAGFPAGEANGHHLVNRSSEPAMILEVGSREADDDVFYADIDMQLLKAARGGRFTRRSGEPYGD